MNQGKLLRQKTLENQRLSSQTVETFTSKCSIERSTNTPNGAGGFTEVWSVPTGLSNLDCALNQKSPGSEDLVADQPGAINLFVIHLPPGTDIRHKDRVLIGSNRYQVNSIPEPVSIEVARTVYAYWIE